MATAIYVNINIWNWEVLKTMPFKTKRQKISAAQRRFIFSEGKVSLVGTEGRPNSNVTEAAQMGQGDTSYEDSNIDDRLLLKKDLLRILVISFLVIVSQVTLRLTLF